MNSSNYEKQKKNYHNPQRPCFGEPNVQDSHSEKV